MRAKRIVRIESLSWRVRFAMFVSIFGIIWLFVDPLPSFGIGIDFINSLGSFGYLGLIALAIGLTMLIEQLNKIRIGGKITFIRLTFILNESGTRFLVEAPRDMTVKVFVELLLKNLSQNVDSKSSLSRHEMYKTTLFVERSGKFEPVLDSQTIGETGLKDGDLCKLQGKILKRQSWYMSD